MTATPSTTSLLDLPQELVGHVYAMLDAAEDTEARKNLFSCCRNLRCNPFILAQITALTVREFPSTPGCLCWPHGAHITALTLGCQPSVDSGSDCTDAQLILEALQPQDDAKFREISQGLRGIKQLSLVNVHLRDPKQAKFLGDVLRTMLPRLVELSITHNSEDLPEGREYDHFEHFVASFASDTSPSAPGVNADAGCGLKKLELELGVESSSLTSAAYAESLAKIKSLQSLDLFIREHLPSRFPLPALELQHLNTDHAGPFPAALLAHLKSLTLEILYEDARPLLQDPVCLPHLQSMRFNMVERTDLGYVLHLFSLHSMPSLQSLCFDYIEGEGVPIEVGWLTSHFAALPEHAHVTIDYIADNVECIVALLQSMHHAKKTFTIHEMTVTSKTAPADRFVQLASLLTPSSLQEGFHLKFWDGANQGDHLPCLQAIVEHFPLLKPPSLEFSKDIRDPGPRLSPFSSRRYLQNIISLYYS